MNDIQFNIRFFVNLFFSYFFLKLSQEQHKISKKQSIDSALKNA